MEDNYKSRTQLKKEMTALQEMGKTLIKMPDSRLKAMNLPPELAQAVRDAKTITKHEAVRRQMQYIGKLMRDIDLEEIQEHLDAWDQGRAVVTQAFQQAESWRDRLVSGDMGALEEILEQYPLADRQQLRTLALNAKREREKNKPPHAFRALFRTIKELKE
ncbi:MAG: ribosome biogenesis factor YjgA [Desulfovibrio sp.]|uniref:ribosome biogenesis factor YjgA n=1 Tax=Desulfovibrio sp. 7SRBS1 TaxID=3378064 RepID=UPI003B3F5A7D